MKKQILLIVCLAISWSLSSQVIKKYYAANTGCCVYMYCDPGTFSLDLSPDSSEVYTGTCDIDSVTYTVILVKFKSKVESIDAAEDVVVSYLDYLKSAFKINKSVGYGKGNRLNNDENTRGVVDYWEDTSGNHIKIKGWTNGAFIGVLMVTSNAEINEDKVNFFLNGLRFP